MYFLSEDLISYFSSLAKAYLPNGTEMQNLNVFRCYTCRAQNPRYFVEDFAQQISYVFEWIFIEIFDGKFSSQAEKDCQNIERLIQEAKGKLTETQKRVNEHQQTITSLETTINEIKIKYGRLGKVTIRNEEKYFEYFV